MFLWHENHSAGAEGLPAKKRNYLVSVPPLNHGLSVTAGDDARIASSKRPT
jgi:hypothetical protein